MEIGKEILAIGFKDRHRKSKKSFSRNRKLSFVTVIGLLLQKSAKSLQTRLNEYFEFDDKRLVTVSAYSQARANFKHTAFIELNQRFLIENFYNEEAYKTYKGHRLLAVDGSKLRLPDSKSAREEFGTIRIKNQHTEDTYTGALASVLYDVLNARAIDSIISPANSSERYLAERHLAFCNEKDIVIFDRGYFSFILFAKILAKKANFVCRCSSNACNIVKRFIDSDERDITVFLDAQEDIITSAHLQGLPQQISVRFVKVELENGESEVLITSLLNQQEHPLVDFKSLYFHRWGIETFFDRLKNCLSLENFTGKSAESIRQDFYSSIFIANAETELTYEINDNLEQNSNELCYGYKVNKAISYNVLKNNIFEILFAPESQQENLFDDLQRVLLTNKVPIRPNRSNERNMKNPKKANAFLRYRKKMVF